LLTESQAQTDQYSVRHLPSTPDILRNSASGTNLSPDRSPSLSDHNPDYRASILSSQTLALAVTRERAYIWDYTSPAPVSHPKTFDVPRPARSTDPLPLAALVTSPTRDVGLLVISAITGNVTYWQNINTAESLTLFNQQNTAVSGNIGSLSSGETVIRLDSADHAGFIVTLSSGRIAQMSLIDDQGKPKISAHFLRSTEAASSGGLFGSLKNALGVGPWKRDIVSVRTRPLPARREIQAVAATETGQIYTWHLAWSGQPTFRGAFDFRQFLQNELAASLGENNISLLDMVITPASSAVDAKLQLILFVQAGPASSPSYAMAQVTMETEDRARLDGIIRINTVSPDSPATSRPRLLLPDPGHTAFIVFEREVIVVDITSSDCYQDAIRLRSDKHVTIEGACEEDLIDTKSTSSCAVFIKGHGLARISATPTEASHPSIKTKIEQAIFYGTMSENVLDFSRRPYDRYDIEETEAAALSISGEILRSTSHFIPPLTSSMEAHLQNRIKAIRALILHLRSDYPPVSRPTSWKLLLDAEKLAAAQAIWATCEERSSKSTLLPLVVHAYYRFQSGQQSFDASTDLVRSWFVEEIANIDKLRTYVLVFINNVHEDNKSKNLMQYISEADDILFSLYDAVFDFRTDNAEVYGMDLTLFSDGVLEEGYEDLIEPWTSQFEVLKSLNRFIDISRERAVNSFGEDSKTSDVATVDKVVSENVRMVNVLCLCYRERIAYTKVHNEQNSPSYAVSLEKIFEQARAHHLRSLNKIGESAAGISIAERYGDMQTLVQLVIEESQFMSNILNDPGTVSQDRTETRANMDKLQTKVEGYFKTFGEQWANAFFDNHLARRHSYGLLKEAEDFKEPLTRYLRAEKARGRLSWINDVLREGDFQEASTTLTTLAEEKEVKFWNKKVELSLAKLTSLAATEGKSGKGNLERLNGDLTVVNTQEAIRQHLQYILYAAVDIEAEVQLACDTYAAYLQLRTPALYGLLEASLMHMLRNEALSVEELIDILTLMDTKESEDSEVNIIGKQFLMALQVLEAGKSRMEEARFETNLRMIWKRCYLQDDWEFINNTKKRTDKLISRHIRDTFACQTMMRGLELCKFERIEDKYWADDIEIALFHPGSGIRMMTPSETLGAGCTAGELQSRFPGEELRDPIMHDNLIQDRQLQELIEKCNADRWHAVCVEEAKKKLEEEAAANVQEEAAAQQLKQTLEEAEKDGAETNADTDAPMEGDSAGGESEQERADDGDVQMA
jgi:nuclear pore complex protein Nup133